MPQAITPSSRALPRVSATALDFARSLRAPFVSARPQPLMRPPRVSATPRASVPTAVPTRRAEPPPIRPQGGRDSAAVVQSLRPVRDHATIVQSLRPFTREAAAPLPAGGREARELRCAARSESAPSRGTPNGAAAGLDGEPTGVL